MAIKYPDYATQSRQAFIRYQSRRVLLDEHEQQLVDDSEESSVSKVAVAIAITTVLLLSLYFFNTQAHGSDGNIMPVSPMSLVDHLGEE